MCIRDRIPTGIPETDIQTAYGIGAFFAALFGPIAGGLISFIGHALSDSIQYGSAWWSWVIASGLTCFITGFVYPRLRVEAVSYTHLVWWIRESDLREEASL